MHWVTRLDARWVDRHVAHYANIAGPVFGVPKVRRPFSFMSMPMRRTGLEWERGS